MAEYVVLVDEQDQQIGTMEKMEAHREGLLHRAFSVFVMNAKGEIMMQQRAEHKYHSGGLWTNTCCSHPRENEDIEDAAHRRMKEEMGFDCEMRKLLEFTYLARLDKGMTEHEYDHLYIGYFDGEPQPNPGEASNWKWMSIDSVTKDLRQNPGHYTEWFKIIFDRFSEKVTELS
ncbi:MAG: isopentenyl-diphosphate Delta-isomerase [Owenweeksia sp.]|nr:isopentenyl-diphosphate Delta-isomerase [Owenweeksia sp.]